MKRHHVMRPRMYTLGLLLTILLILIPSITSEARPYRGTVLWSVILCQTNNAGTPPHNVQYYLDLIVNQGTGGLADYWNDISYQNVTLGGSVVRGWYTIPKTTAEYTAASRDDKMTLCETAARTDPTQPYTIPAGNKRVYVTFPSVDLFGWDGGAFVPWDTDVGALAHEGGHGLGLNHSFSNDPDNLNIWWAAASEYDDPWDAMSWANAFRVRTARFGDAAPWMIAHQLDRMGWLPRSRIVVAGANGVKRNTYTLAALSHPEAAGALMIRVPIDPFDAMHYYTIEFRRRDRWDAGIPNDTILIHEIAKRWDTQGNYVGHHIYLQRNLADPFRTPLQNLSGNGIFIKLESINTTTNQATVTVYNDTIDRCLPGYVWREIRTYDHVCVTAAERATIRQENTLADSRRNPNGGAFGPDTCKQGFVWREALRPLASDDPGDHVCVTAARRAAVQVDNRESPNRKNIARFAYGPNTCKQGFVWREADDWDYVCVTAAIRQQVRNDNALAPTRRNPAGGPYGPDTCLQGFVWREAYPRDHVCVVPATRTQARNDNAMAQQRLLEY